MNLVSYKDEHLKAITHLRYSVIVHHQALLLRLVASRVEGPTVSRSVQTVKTIESLQLMIMCYKNEIELN